MKKILVLIGALAVSSLAHADYAFGPFYSWRYVDSHHIIVQGAGNFLLTMPSCFVNMASNVKVLSDTLGPWDGKVMVDGQVCDIQDVSRI